MARILIDDDTCRLFPICLNHSSQVENLEATWSSDLGVLARCLLDLKDSDQVDQTPAVFSCCKPPSPVAKCLSPAVDFSKAASSGVAA